MACLRSPTRQRMAAVEVGVAVAALTGAYTVWSRLNTTGGRWPRTQRHTWQLYVDCTGEEKVVGAATAMSLGASWAERVVGGAERTFFVYIQLHRR